MFLCFFHKLLIIFCIFLYIVGTQVSSTLFLLRNPLKVEALSIATQQGVGGSKFKERERKEE